MTLSPHVVQKFLARELNDFEWLKNITDEELWDAINEIRPLPKFHTKPFRHQMACFLIGYYFPQFLMLLDMGLGKALPNYQGVLTPEGYKPIGSIEVGDYVVAPTGKPIRVTGVYPQGVKKVYEITFSDKTKVRSCGDHLWHVFSPKQKQRNQFEVLPLKQFKDDLRFKGNKYRKRFIPVSKPVEFISKGKLPLDPYLLGCWLGDGYSTTLSNIDSELVKECFSKLPEGMCGVSYSELFHNFRKVVRNKSPNPFKSKLEELGLWNKLSYDKFIPEEYLYSSIEERIELLQGLMDTDGTAGSGGYLNFCTTSKYLSDGVKFLVQSLGGTSSIKVRHGENSTRKVDYYSHYIVLPTDIIPFKLARKRERLIGKKRRTYGPTRAFERVDYIGEEECTCISVDSMDGLFLTEEMVVTHNTKIILDLLYQFRREGRFSKAIIVVPAVAHVQNWIEEVAVHRPELSCAPLLGTTASRRAASIEMEETLGIINYQGFMMICSRQEPKGKNGALKNVISEKTAKPVADAFEAIVLDESQKIKNRNSLQWKACNYVGKACEIRFALTGTPVGRDPQDFWSQYYFIDRGYTLGPTLTFFRDCFFDKKPKYFGGFEWKLKKDRKDLLYKTLRNISLWYGEEECNDLPEKVYIKRHVEFPAEFHEYYYGICEEMADAKGDYHLVESAFHRMRNIASGYLTAKDDESEKKVQIQFPSNPKIDEVLEIIDDMPPDAKVVVFYEYTATAKILCDVLSKHKIQHEWLYSGTKDQIATITSFKTKKKCRALVCQSKIGSSGLNLQVANYVIFLESPVSPIDRQQAEKRCHREGQKSKRVFYYDLIMENTVDERILEYIKEGKSLFQSLVKGKFKVKDLFDAAFK